jgi:hypothetical protein
MSDTKTKSEQIVEIEERIKHLFAESSLTKEQLKTSNSLIEEWKVLTGWKTDETPFLKGSHDRILDDKPVWYYKLSQKY